MIPFTDKLFENSSNYNNLVFEKIEIEKTHSNFYGRQADYIIFDTLITDYKVEKKQMIPFTDKLFEDSSNYNNLVREKVPVYTLGDANPRSFGRGKRGICRFHGIYSV